MSTYPVLDERPIDQWKVTELKDELERRKLPIKGLKDDLVRTLFEAIQGEALDGGEETSPVTPPVEELKGGETTGSRDASVYEALIEQNVDEGLSEVTKQGADPDTYVTDTSNESLVANLDVSQEAIVGTAEVSQLVVVGTAEVSQKGVVGNREVSQRTLGAVVEVEAPPVDVGPAATDDSCCESNVVDLETAPSGNSLVKDVHPHPEGHDDTIEKTPEDDSSDKMAVHDLPSDTTSINIKLGIDVDTKILRQEAVTTPPRTIVLHANDRDADIVAAPEPGDGTSKKMAIGDVLPTSSNVRLVVSEVNPDLGCKIKPVSVSDDIPTNEKCNMNAGNSDLKLVVKLEMVKPLSTIRSRGDDLLALDSNKELHKNGTTLQELQSTTNIDLDRKEDSPDGSSLEKVNLDKSSGDESMDEDVMESKHVESNIKSDDGGGRTKVTSDHVLKELALVDTVPKGSLPCTKEVVAEEKPPSPTDKRKIEGQGVIANSEPNKRQRQWNVDTVNIRDQQASKLTGTGTSKFQGSLLVRCFGRSDSTASGDSQKERIVYHLLKKSATTSLRIDRFVRPFTLKAVQELLGKSGSVCSFWMDHIKTHCYVTLTLQWRKLWPAGMLFTTSNGPQTTAVIWLLNLLIPKRVKHKLELPTRCQAPISPITASAPQAAPIQQSEGNQMAPLHAAATSRGLLPTPPLAKPPVTSDPGPEREGLRPPNKLEPPPTLDDLFKKTQAYPRIYYMPLNEEEASAKLAARGKGMRG
ncbi:hypothetical protein ACP70R_004779 [Stipagrostis hirtigluma subsp. patula]